MFTGEISYSYVFSPTNWQLPRLLADTDATWFQRCWADKPCWKQQPALSINANKSAILHCQVIDSLPLRRLVSNLWSSLSGCSFSFPNKQSPCQRLFPLSDPPHPFSLTSPLSPAISCSFSIKCLSPCSSKPMSLQNTHVRNAIKSSCNSWRPSNIHECISITHSVTLSIKDWDVCVFSEPPACPTDYPKTETCSESRPEHTT